ncbi:hypothetical protein [Vibrio owensii]|uniref:hypothetical protein n=1 Tax=Vibrio harveyi group TaxID=717610 RepID=UPI003CC5AD17
MNIKDKVRQDKEALINALNSDPTAIEREQGIVRVFYARNTDKNDLSNEPCMVLTHDMPEEHITNFVIASLVGQRRLDENKAITPSISMLTGDLSSGKIKLNEDVLDALLKFDSSLGTYRNKVFSSHLIDLAYISSKLEEKGVKPNSIELMRDNILTLAETALAANTDENGNCPLTTIDHLVNNMLSRQGQKRIFDLDNTTVGMIQALNKSVPSRQHEDSLSM